MYLCVDKYNKMGALVINTEDQKVLKLLSEIAIQLGATVEKSTYSPKFVAKIKKARSEKEGKTVTSENLWQSIQ